MRAAGLRVALTATACPGAWGPGAGLAVYRIVQEALTNTLKHAGPHAAAQVRLRYDARRRASVEVIDDGAGRPVAAPRGDGHGLAGHGRAGRVVRRRRRGRAARRGAGWRVRAAAALRRTAEATA